MVVNKELRNSTPFGGDMSAEENAGEKPAEAKPKLPKNKKLILAAVGLLSLVGGAGVPMLLMGGGEPEEATEVVEEEPIEAPKRIEVADLGVFVVNLSENTSFLKVHIMMEYDAAVLDKQTAIAVGGEAGGKGHGGGASGGEEAAAEGASGVHPYLAKRENQLRDVVIRILSAKRSSDVLTIDGKARIKEELVDGLNEALALEEPPVVGILFTEFIIQ